MINRLLRAVPLAALIVVGPVPQVVAAEAYDMSAACCRVCTQGKACGDTCIAKEYECHQAPGCACDG